MLYKIFKYVFDRLAALVLIIITIPIQILILVVLFFELKEFPIFFQKRGLKISENVFTVFKFKTIKSKHSYIIEHEVSSHIFLVEDKSITLSPFAKILRRTGLDELLQFYNILFGTMSFVGPRPLMIRDLEIMEKEFPREYRTRSELKSKPGLTGLWQVFGNRNLGVENLLALDLFYEDNRSFKIDFEIMLLTIPIILLAKNSDAFIPRIDFVSKFYSMKMGEFCIREKHKSQPSDSGNYSLKIPVDWWYTSNTYHTSTKEKAKIFPIVKKEEKNSQLG